MKDKNTLTKSDEATVINKARELGDEQFADCYAWLIDVGMRYESEFQTFTIKDINWKKKTICFYRGKTESYSVNLPLTISICNNLLESLFLSLILAVFSCPT